MSHETNTFSQVETQLKDFNPCYGQEISEVYGNTRTELGGFLAILQQHNIETVPTLAASATPSGPLVHEDYKLICQKIVDGVRDAGILDGILLSLHGAMVAQGVSEAEGNLLQRLRLLLGQTIPIICTLDLHALVSEQMISQADAIFGYNTNPHIDQYERGVEAAECMIATLKGMSHPVTVFTKLPMMPPTINMRTTEGPMVNLFERARAMEASPQVINVSIFGGFPYADVARVGSSIVVVTENNRDLAQQTSNELGSAMWRHRFEFLKPLVSVETAVQRTKNMCARAEEGPIILADVSDNPGGGAPGDGTVILQQLLEYGVKNVGFAVIKDPAAVQHAMEVGIGEPFSIKIGGKTDQHHGQPLQVSGVVKTLTDGIFVNKAVRSGMRVNVGKTAVIDAAGIEIILTEKSHAPNDPEIFRRNGIEPFDKEVLVLKSRGHFRAAYEPYAKEVIEVDAPGITSPNLSLFTFRRIPRPMWPISEASG
jgi:microcystin degradation protein MlrC